MAGRVRDTSLFLVEGVEVSIPKLQRRTYSRADGSFRFDSLKKGTYEVRARKFGYGPQVIEVKVDSLGGLGDFELVPIPRALPAVVTSAARLGLSGVVADTAFENLPGAFVKVLGHGMSTETDSMGSFYLPVGQGSYMVSITKPDFADRVVSVRIPSDSGRRITVSLQPSSGEPTVREAWNLADLGYRTAWFQTAGKFAFYTHEEMEKLGIEWIDDAVRGGAGRAGFFREVDAKCSAIVNGGPKIAMLSELTVDEIESVEIYAAGGRNLGIASRRPPSSGRIVSGRSGVANSRPATSLTNVERAGAANRGKSCPIVYVWTR